MISVCLLERYFKIGLPFCGGIPLLNVILYYLVKLATLLIQMFLLFDLQLRHLGDLNNQSLSSFAKHLPVLDDLFLFRIALRKKTPAIFFELPHSILFYHAVIALNQTCQFLQITHLNGVSF